MDKTRIHVGKITDRKDDDYVTGTKAERLAMVWALTRDTASLNKNFDVERRLQRHVAVLGRRER
ncbi:MAG TPA: hypothetical protein PKC67_10590 [Kiritimatiellia bacterium]|nr:hypothetical protein [Kiritimatiellia bacterium]HMP34787.1 hypothetical protein [Kiritimatiellia bacterium]